MKSTISLFGLWTVCSLFLFTGCSSDDCNNACKELTLDCNCCPSVASVKSQSPSISNVTMFLETSGSMSGYMPPSGGTSFQKLVPNIISKLKDFKLVLYSIKESSENPIPISADIGSKRIVDGLFPEGKNTAIPAMIDTINHYQEDNNVTLLVSDMIFSPKDQSEVSQEITQIAEKIRAKNSSITASLVMMTSDFHSTKYGSTDQSPYYILLRGKRENIEAVKAKIMQAAELFHQVPREVNFGYTYPAPSYTIIPYFQKAKVGLIQACDNSKKERYRINNIEGADSLSFWLGLNLTQLPDYSQNETYLKKYLTIKPEGAKAELVNVMSKHTFLNLLSDPTDRQLAEGCTHFVRIRVTDFGVRAALLNLVLSDAEPQWVNNYNHDILAKADSNRSQTFGLNSIYTAIVDAFAEKTKRPLFNSVKISLAKK